MLANAPDERGVCGEGACLPGLTVTELVEYLSVPGSVEAMVCVPPSFSSTATSVFSVDSSLMAS